MKLKSTTRLALALCGVWSLLWLPAFADDDVTTRYPAPRVANPGRQKVLDVAFSHDRFFAVGPHGLIVTGGTSGSSKMPLQVDSPTDATLTCIVFTDSHHGFIGGHEGTLMKTEDGGGSWHIIRTDSQSPAILKLLFVSKSVGFAVGGNGLFLRTVDGGHQWEAKTLIAEEGFAPNLFDVGMLSDGTTLVVGEGGRIFRSADQGRHWDGIQTPYSGSLFTLAPMGSNSVAAFGMLGNAVQSSDNGLTWSIWHLGLKSSIFTASWFGDELFLGGADGLLSRFRAGTLGTISGVKGSTVASMIVSGDGKKILAATDLGILTVPVQ